MTGETRIHQELEVELFFSRVPASLLPCTNAANLEVSSTSKAEKSSKKKIVVEICYMFL